MLNFVHPDEPFVAIDFETADHYPDSACAVALVRVESRRIVGREVVYLRPPRPWILFTHVHGITWDHVANAPRFADAWPRLQPMLDRVAFLAAHNAHFDRRVLAACCRIAGLSEPQLPFVCTVQLARKRWAQRGNSLPAVCQRLGIQLCHHDPLSDAEACARIVLAATKSSI